MIALTVAMLLAVPPAPPSSLPGPCAAPVKTVTTTQRTTVLSHRAPVGHTHTCPAGHTWDHKENPTHTCHVCGRQQWVQDHAPRMVTVIRAAASSVQEGVVPATIVPRSIMRSQSGCPNGNCPLR